MSVWQYVVGSLRTRTEQQMHHWFGILTSFLFVASLIANSKCLEIDHRRASVTLSDLETVLGEELHWKAKRKKLIQNQNMTEKTIRSVSTQSTGKSDRVSHHHVSTTCHTSHRPPRYAAYQTRLHNCWWTLASCVAPRWHKGSYDSWKTAWISPKLEPMEVASRYNSSNVVSFTCKNIVRCI